MYAPIANNIVLIAVLVEFRVIVGSHPSIVGLLAHQRWILLLGLGTTAGVVVQAASLIPSLRRANLGLSWHLDPKHHAVRTVIGLSGWTFGLVIANQLALLVVLAVSFSIHTAGAVSAYSYAYKFFQLPYGILAVSIMTATTPVLAEHWTRGDLEAFKVRLSTGLRTMLALIIPAAVGMLVLARPFVEVLGKGTTATGQSLSMLAIGIPGFCVFLYTIRAFQAIQDLRSAFWLYVVENAINIALAIALAPSLGVRGVSLSISVAYTVAAITALIVLRRKIGGIRGDLLAAPVRRVVVSSVALAVAASLGVNVSASGSEILLLVRLGLGVLAGGAAFVLVAGLLAQLNLARTTGRGPSHARSTRQGRRRGRIKD
jgi:putative peptidoglycan lipid II flippase